MSIRHTLLLVKNFVPNFLTEEKHKRMSDNEASKVTNDVGASAGTAVDSKAEDNGAAKKKGYKNMTIILDLMC